ncbi:MAG TPA: cytochrome c3 family protein [Candidatus Acidoferrum sp.]
MRKSAPDGITKSATYLFFERILLFPFLLFGISLLTPGKVHGQISPGPLSKAHSSLSGTSQCASCHSFGTSTPTFKCIDCHKEVAQDLSAKHGYHFEMQMRNPNGKDCVRCHLEHNGEAFQLIHWDPSLQKFDHKLTGYKLEGKHANLACEKCHTPAHMLPANRELIKMKDLSKSFFGQSPSCTPCHSDPHNGQLGNECTKCHNVESWKAAKDFDHSKTRYPLTGLHIRVPCEKCHKAETPGGPVRYQNMKFDTCTACHVDPHKGEFKKSCESCHTTSSWKNLLPSFDFDHSKTKYPLVGKHVQVACVACHLNGDFKTQIPFANCGDCHKPDPHKGQFEKREKKGECSECHNLEGWKPSLFGVKEHDNSGYPLKGKHVQVECAKCHIPAGKDTIYKVKFAACTDCHKDAHDNQFAAAPYNNRCEPCHTVVDFHRTTFTIAKHKATRFPLAGAHVAVPCADCHKAGTGGRADRILPFHFEDRTCTACHKDPHKGEFNDRMARRRANGTPFGCEACHSVKSWVDINGFDHSKTKFPLLGAHRTVTCGECHKPTTSYDSRFKGTSQQCEACHIDAHDSQFQAKDGKTHCVDCHNAQRWVPSTFDHDTRTHFALTGGHAKVPCAKCHIQTKLVGEKSIVIYKNTPMKCVDCHGDNPKIMNSQQPIS